MTPCDGGREEVTASERGKEEEWEGVRKEGRNELREGGTE